ncbi:hypothetical protein [Rhodococcus jostii]|uniref:Uncharacterized protein n=1 Tax=Rhodococcus jostii TaxID=132919 RepID=A0A1H5LX64_RHOJO|nr:hypothetical protein [Rhodococcus jostii]SEE81564.1 hypothetical protein SAMN04490220_8482 [Rhodococcus jostii]
MTAGEGPRREPRQRILDPVRGDERAAADEADAKITAAQGDRQREHDAAEQEATRGAEKGRLEAEERARVRVHHAEKKRRIEDLRTAGDVVDARDDDARAQQRARMLDDAAEAVRSEAENDRGRGAVNLSSLPRTVLRVQYAVVRLPLAVIDRRVVQRWGAQAPVRLAYEWALGGLDGVVGALLGDHDLIDRSHRNRRHADMLTRAAVLGDRAKRIRVDAAEQLPDRLDEAARHTAAVRDATDAAVTEAENTAVEETMRVGDRVGAQLARRKDRADRTADARIRAADADLDAIHRESDRT